MMTELQIACPECGRTLEIKTNRATGTDFLACPGWQEVDHDNRRRCAYTAQLPEFVKMRRAGAASLPGFE